jgi:hypothetical protein
MNLMELANHRCEHLLHAPLLCAETGEHKQHWCWPCKIKQLVMDIQLATASHSVPTEATNEGKPDA